jgi:iron complex transport system substrate-binding protein
MLVLLKLLLVLNLNAEAVPARIVALSPALAEWTAEILGVSTATKVLVGVSEYSDYPAEIKKIVRVGPYPQLNVEQIASLRPTLILASADANRPEQIDKLKRLKLRVEVMPVEKFSDMESWIRKLGKILDEPKGAETAATRWTEGVARLKPPVVGHTPLKRAMIQVQDLPIIAVGGDSFLNEAFAVIGYQNVFAKLNQSYPKVSREAVLAADPDVIFIMDLMGKSDDSKKAREAWKKFDSLKAVKNHDLRMIAADDYARCSLRLLNALKQLH